MKSLKYSEYLKETQTNYRYISYNLLNPPEGARPGRIDYTFADALNILIPYLRSRWNDQMRVVIPITLYLVLFQVLVLRQHVSDWFDISIGIVTVILGLMLFMEGLKVGLMPFGETIGYYLPIKSTRTVVLCIAFMLGVGTTFAEPAIGVLKEAGKIVSPEGSPLLYAMLSHYSHLTVIAVGLGVGLAVLLGILMFIYGWSLKPLIFCSIIPTLALTLYASSDPLLSGIIGLAWDCGAVTTGPVTVPLILSLGIGTAGVIKHKHSKNLQGFGLVTLASLLPVFSVLLLGLILNLYAPLNLIGQAESLEYPISWFEHPVWQGIILGTRAIMPLVIFLYFVQIRVIREPVHNPSIILYGIILSLIGMSLFNIGLSYGLTPLGNQVGSLVPASYSELEFVERSPFFTETIGLAVCFIFAFLLGYGATLAEPALNALGMTVENLTNGAFRKRLVMISVSLGVAIGIMVGVIKMIFNVPLVWLILTTYTIALVLTVIAEEKYVNLGWDSAGVTTGPITVPLVIAMGLGFANASGAADGFGILAMASVFPIISVLSVGIYVHWMEKKKVMEDVT